MLNFTPSSLRALTCTVITRAPGLWVPGPERLGPSSRRPDRLVPVGSGAGGVRRGRHATGSAGRGVVDDGRHAGRAQAALEALGVLQAADLTVTLPSARGCTA